MARIAPPIRSGRAVPAPVFGIVCPSTLLVGAGAVVEPAFGDALGDADFDPDGSKPGPADPDGEGEPDGETEPDGVGDV